MHKSLIFDPFVGVHSAQDIIRRFLLFFHLLCLRHQCLFMKAFNLLLFAQPFDAFREWRCRGVFFFTLAEAGRLWRVKRSGTVFTSFKVSFWRAVQIFIHTLSACLADSLNL